MSFVSVSRNAWYYPILRWWASVLHWTWGIKPKDQTVCRAVWGTIGFFPFGLLYRLTGDGLSVCALTVAGLSAVTGSYVLVGIMLGIVITNSYFARKEKAQQRQPGGSKEMERLRQSEKFEEGLEKIRNRFATVPDYYRRLPEFIRIALALPLILTVSLGKLLILLLEPIIVPPATYLLDMFDRRAERNREYYQPNLLVEMFTTFHDRTCRRFNIVE